MAASPGGTVSDIPVEGTVAKPLRLDPFQRVVEVHFGAGIGVLQIDFPKGLEIKFDPDNSEWPLHKLGPKSLDFGEDPVINKARLTEQSIFLSVLKQGIVDGAIYTETIRTLEEGESTVGYTLITGAELSLPDDLIRDFPDQANDILAYNFAEYAAFNVIQCAGTRISYLPVDPSSAVFVATAETTPFCDPAKPAPGAQFYAWWKVIPDNAPGDKVLVRAAWIIDFTKWLPSQGANPVTIRNIDPIDVPELGGIRVDLTLKLYRGSTTLTVQTLGDITADREPYYTKKIDIPYLEPILAKFSRAGFVN